MRVRVERSGGFAGVVLRGEADTAHLDTSDPQAAQALRDLAGRVDFAGLRRGTAAAPGGGRGADRFSYRVQVEDDDGAPGAATSRALDVQLGEGQVPAALRRLIDHVLRYRGPAPGG